MAAPPVAITGRASKQRVFLIIDLKDSSAAAERLGEVDFHHMLSRLVGDLTGPIVRQKGQIHKYVGKDLTHMPFLFMATDESGWGSRLATMSLAAAAYFL